MWLRLPRKPVPFHSMLDFRGCRRLGRLGVVAAAEIGHACSRRLLPAGYLPTGVLICAAATCIFLRGSQSVLDTWSNLVRQDGSSEFGHLTFISLEFADDVSSPVYAFHPACYHLRRRPLVYRRPSWPPLSIASTRSSLRRKGRPSRMGSRTQLEARFLHSFPLELCRMVASYFIREYVAIFGSAPADYSVPPVSAFREVSFRIERSTGRRDSTATVPRPNHLYRV
ncbi:hypothetical protein F5Y17DRAFT_255778 [Xylariaceae sp. FL0594]|nr:hypothetical protein F5Y17DRAFT_255778 [Xylariaceae sp. FL0594]